MIKQAFAAATACAALVAFVSSVHAQVATTSVDPAAVDPAAATHLGNPYVPQGANFTVSGLQGIDSANLLGQSGFSTQVNQNFEFKGTLGVTYQKDDKGGKLSDFGLGLYQTASKAIESTGIRVD